ncbi:MAG: hypothetical protein ACLFUC_06070 [Bacteroidales bacterium]
MNGINLQNLIMLTSASAFVMTGCADNNTEKPNIILILCDDMGYSDLGCYGSEISTPHLDKLRMKGCK